MHFFILNMLLVYISPICSHASLVVVSQVQFIEKEKRRRELNAFSALLTLIYAAAFIKLVNEISPLLSVE